MLAIDGATARRLLPMDRCVDLMHEALAGLARGNAANPLRSMLLMPFETPVPSVLASMPAALGDPPALGIKVISVFPGNHGTGFESHQGFVLLFEPEHGSPVALIDAIAITAIRTAAVSGLATRLLARADATDLAIIGSGTQARSHLDAMRAVRSIGRVRVWSPHRERLDAFVADAADAGITVEASADARAAVEGADIVCTVTASSHAGGRRRLAGRRRAHQRRRLIAGHAPRARQRGGAALAPVRRPARIGAATRRATTSSRCARAPSARTTSWPRSARSLPAWREGRRSADEITLFKSLGLAIEDLAAARWIHQRALEHGSRHARSRSAERGGAAAGGRPGRGPRPHAERMRGGVGSHAPASHSKPMARSEHPPQAREPAAHRLFKLRGARNAVAALTPTSSRDGRVHGQRRQHGARVAWVAQRRACRRR